MVQGVLLVPLYLHSIGPALYGAWLGSGDIIGWLAILDMGLASLLIQRIGTAYGQGNHQFVGAYLATGMLSQLVLVALLIAGTAMLSVVVPGWMGISGADAQVLAGSMTLAGIATGLNILSNGLSGFAMALQRTIVMSIAIFIGAVSGISLTVLLLFQGWGLWAIPLGWLTREAITLSGNLIYASILYRREITVPLRLSRQVLRDFAAVLPAVFVAKLGAALANRSEAALIAILIKPELATIYVLTRRAADILRLVLDRFGAATFAGFAHLLGSGQKQRAIEVYREIIGLYAPISVLAISLYLALNQTFITIWVGPQFFAGQLLTTLVGLSVIAAASSNLINYLYGATGQIARGSWLLLVEGLLRFGLMALLLQQVGLVGMPLVMLVTSSLVAVISWRWIRQELGVAADLRLAPAGWPLLAGLLLLSAAIGTQIWATTWLGMALVALVVGISLCAGTLAVSVPLRIFAHSMFRRITRAPA